MTSEIRSLPEDKDSCRQTLVGLQKEFPGNPLFPKELARLEMSLAADLSRELRVASK
jgi:hypothetical protein